MKQFLINSLRKLSFLLPLPSLIALTGQPLFLPFYHAIQGKAPLPHIHHLYTLRTEAQFEKDLIYLLKHFNPLSLEQLYDVICGKSKLQKPAFHLTFDDGLREVYDIAAPTLKRMGIPATIFLNSGFVNNQGLFFRYKVSLLLNKLRSKNPSDHQLIKAKEVLSNHSLASPDLVESLLALKYHDEQLIDQLAELLDYSFDDFLIKQKPYLTSTQINLLREDGFTFGAHSVDHPLYNQLSLEQQLLQTSKSIQFVQKHFNPPINCFSFPFTDDGVDLAFFTQLRKKSITALTFGCAGLKDDSAPNHLQRFPMEGTEQSVDKLIKAEYAYCLIKSAFNKNKVIRS